VMRDWSRVIMGKLDFGIQSDGVDLGFVFKIYRLFSLSFFSAGVVWFFSSWDVYFYLEPAICYTSK